MCENSATNKVDLIFKFPLKPKVVKIKIFLGEQQLLHYWRRGSFSVEICMLTLKVTLLILVIYTEKRRLTNFCASEAKANEWFQFPQQVCEIIHSKSLIFEQHDWIFSVHISNSVWTFHVWLLNTEKKRKNTHTHTRFSKIWAHKSKTTLERVEIFRVTTTDCTRTG